MDNPISNTKILAANAVAIVIGWSGRMYELSVGRDGVSGTIRYFVIIDITQHRIPAHLWTEQSILTHTRKGDEAYPSMHTFVQIMYNLT